MGWESRGGRDYYYRKRRRGGRVVSEYVGAGDFATLAALLDEEDRDEAAECREQRRADRELERRLDELIRQAKDEAGAYLRGLGFYQHKRAWRLRRVRHAD